jgi:hypothetical protein
VRGGGVLTLVIAEGEEEAAETDGDEEEEGWPGQMVRRRADLGAPASVMQTSRKTRSPWSRSHAQVSSPASMAAATDGRQRRCFLTGGFCPGKKGRWRRLGEEKLARVLGGAAVLLIKGRGGPSDGEGGDVEEQRSPLPDMVSSSTWKGGEERVLVPIRSIGVGPEVGFGGRIRKREMGCCGLWLGRLDRV